MGKNEAKPIQTPFQQQQQQSNTYAYMSPLNSGAPGVEDYLKTPLNFGDPNAYSGNAYQDIKNDFKFNIDPGVGHRGDLAEQEIENRYNSAFSSGVPAYIREANKAKELRGAQAQTAAERQQAEFTRQNAQQQADYQSSLARAGMRDAAELNKANMANNILSQGTLADLARKERLLPQLVQTGGSGNSSGYNTQLAQPQGGFWNSFTNSLGTTLGKV